MITRFYSFMLGILIIVLGIALATPIKDVVDNAMGFSEINCATPATDFDQATCWFMQIEKFLYTGGIIAIGLAILVSGRYTI